MTAEVVTIYSIYTGYGDDPARLVSALGKRTEKQVRITEGWGQRQYFGYRTLIPISECYFSPQEAIDAFRRTAEITYTETAKKLAMTRNHLDQIREIESSL